MNAPASFPVRAARRELRLLAGSRGGASHRLEGEGPFLVGHRLDNDIVIRGRGTPDVRLTLAIGPSGIAEVTVLSGEVRLLGGRFGPGSPVHLPDYVPMFMGELAFALGEEGHHRWMEAEALARAPLPAAAEPVAAAPADLRRRVGALSAHARRRISRAGPLVPEWRPGRWLVAGAAMLLLLAALVDPLARWVSTGLAGQRAAQSAVAEAGLAGVTVRQLPTGTLLYSGQVRDEAALVDLRGIAARFGPSQIQVTSAVQLAEAATDALRSQGIDADVRAAGMGAIVVESEYLPRDRQVELTERLRADIAGLRRVDFRLAGARGQQDLRYFFASGPYGLATFVDGDPGYIATADGSVWFEGAVLPTGHQLVQARAGQLRFRRNGIDETLTMGAPADAAATRADPGGAAMPGRRLALGSGARPTP